jgi:hypothetical protein
MSGTEAQNYRENYLRLRRHIVSMAPDNDVRPTANLHSDLRRLLLVASDTEKRIAARLQQQKETLSELRKANRIARTERVVLMRRMHQIDQAIHGCDHHSRLQTTLSAIRHGHQIEDMRVVINLVDSGSDSEDLDSIPE